MNVGTENMAIEERIRVVVFEDSDKWVAQCLEYDIGAQADTLDELQARLELTLATEFKISVERGGAPFAGVDPAPPHFHKMWESTDSRIFRVDDGVTSPELDIAVCA